MQQFLTFFTISPPLLYLIKRITLLVYELNQRTSPEAVVLQLQSNARAMSVYASTTISDNSLPLIDVKKLLKEPPDNAQPNERMVLNYDHVLSEYKKQPITLFSVDLIQQIHAGLMADLLPTYQVGQWRQEPVTVYEPLGKESIYQPPNHEDVPALMDALVDFVQENQGVLDPMLLAGIFHKQMAIIHPFKDGNGRTARMISSLLLAGLELNTIDLCSFENYYILNVARYFQHVGLIGNYYELAPELDFTPWLVYFAEGVLGELQRVQAHLSQTALSPQTELKTHHQKILETIDEQGFITDRDYSKLTNRARTTRKLDFNKLIKLGLIERQGNGRNTHYRRLA